MTRVVNVTVELQLRGRWLCRILEVFSSALAARALVRMARWRIDRGEWRPLRELEMFRDL